MAMVALQRPTAPPNKPPVVVQQPEQAPLPPPGLLPQAPGPDGKQKVEGQIYIDKCGCFGYRPAYLQGFVTPKWILFNLSWGLFTLSFIVNGCLSVVLPTLERRFQLTSFESGMIISAYNVVNCLCVVPISYLGSSRSKPLFTAAGLLLIAGGSIIFSSPYFLAEPYTFGTERRDSCPADNTTSDCIGSSVRNWRYVLMLGHMMNGAGVIPLHTLGIAYLDENVPMQMTSTYVGIYLAMGVLGPAFGFFVAGTSLSYYEDLSGTTRQGLTSRSSVWVGAWWTGFLFGGFLALFFALPLAAFPRRTPDYDKCQEERKKEKQSTLLSGYGRNIGMLPKDILALLKNRTFVFLSLAAATEAMMTSSLTHFVTKYYQSQFAMTPARAAAIIGVIAIPSGCGGTFLGGAVVSKFNLRTRPMIRLCCIACTAAWMSILVFVLHCPTPEFAINQDVEGDARFAFPCNTECDCKTDILNPICSVDNVVHFSPCYAGCRVQEVLEMGATTYRNCSCIDSSKTGENGTEVQAIRQKCPTKCNLVVLVSVAIFVCVFFTLFNAPPAVTATMRAVHQTERATALAVKWMSIRFFGTIPAPLIIGAAIDQSCVVWQHICDRRGSCVYYDNMSLSHSMLLTLLPIKTFTVILYVCAYRTYKDPLLLHEEKAGDKAVDTMGDAVPQFKAIDTADVKQAIQPVLEAKPTVQQPLPVANN